MLLLTFSKEEDEILFVLRSNHGDLVGDSNFPQMNIQFFVANAKHSTFTFEHSLLVLLNLISIFFTTFHALWENLTTAVVEVMLGFTLLWHGSRYRVVEFVFVWCRVQRVANVRRLL